MRSNPDTRRCPRCGGNLFVSWDERSLYLECLQCSYTVELEKIERKKEKERV